MSETPAPQTETQEIPGLINKQIIRLSTVLQDLGIAYEAKREVPSLTGAKATTLVSTAQRTIEGLKATNAALADLLAEALLSNLHKLHPTAAVILPQQQSLEQRRNEFIRTYYALMRCPNDKVYALGKTFQLKEQAVRSRNEALSHGDQAEALKFNNRVAKAYQAEKILTPLVKSRRRN